MENILTINLEICISKLIFKLTIFFIVNDVL